MQWYSVQINGDMQLEFEAENINSAFNTALTQYLEKYKFIEEPGHDIQIRVWVAYGDGV